MAKIWPFSLRLYLTVTVTAKSFLVLVPGHTAFQVLGLGRRGRRHVKPAPPEEALHLQISGQHSALQDAQACQRQSESRQVSLLFAQRQKDATYTLALGLSCNFKQDQLDAARSLLASSYLKVRTRTGHQAATIQESSWGMVEAIAQSFTIFGKLLN